MHSVVKCYPKYPVSSFQRTLLKNQWGKGKTQKDVVVLPIFSKRFHDPLLYAQKISWSIQKLAPLTFILNSGFIINI